MATLEACDIIKNRVKDVRKYGIIVIRKGGQLGEDDCELRKVSLCMCPQAEARLLRLLDRGTQAPAK
jgi:hypothetical protein